MKAYAAPIVVLLLAPFFAAPAIAQPRLKSAVVGPTAAPPPREGPWDRTVLYGGDLLPLSERKKYRAEIKALETKEEKMARWEEHIEYVRKLALERGVSIDPAPNRPRYEHEKRKYGHPPYFLHLMTGDERYTYRDTLWYIQDDAERKAFVAAHIFDMQARARERGVSFPVPDAYERAALEDVGAKIDSWTGAATVEGGVEAIRSREAGSAKNDGAGGPPATESTADEPTTD